MKTAMQHFNIIRIDTSIDMRIGDRGKSWEYTDGSDLIAGKTFDVYGNKSAILSVDENILAGAGNSPVQYT